VLVRTGLLRRQIDRLLVLDERSVVVVHALVNFARDQMGGD